MSLELIFQLEFVVLGFEDGDTRFFKHSICFYFSHGKQRLGHA